MIECQIHKHDQCKVAQNDLNDDADYLFFLIYI